MRSHAWLNENVGWAAAMAACVATPSWGCGTAAKSHSVSSNEGGSGLAAPDASADRAAGDTTMDGAVEAKESQSPAAPLDGGDDAALGDGAGLAMSRDAEADGADDFREAGNGTIAGRSCTDLPLTCGPAGTEDCCASTVVPGGTFNRSNDPLSPATVSDFRLDVYEITVGRFRKFVADYPAGKPMAGSGKNPHDPTDTGWDAAWPLPVDQAALIRQLKCDSMSNYTWRDVPGTTENLPMNCIDWLVAYAFCIWDGGRLPTEAEWNYAAAGGPEQRYYPWSNPASSMTIEMTLAVYARQYSTGTIPPVDRVGSRSPQGDGKWGHADLAGNLWELTRDQLNLGFTYVNPCVDCTSPEPVNPTTASYPGDAIRGGGFLNPMPDLWTGKRNNIGPASPEADIGARCARQP